ncbi:MAG: multicopper oxidase domain-containing protein, partial [Leptolyngbyaceae bacterium]|nr:multicopper oxidase domain-containing protein [Leptolyngbyaceae bacterium]
MVSSILADAYVIGSSNFQAWSQGYDSSGYLKVLPQHSQEVIFNDPYRNWQLGIPGNYFSSWGAPTELTATLRMSDLTEVKIDGFGILQAGDGLVPWLGNSETPYEALRAYNGTIPGPLFITEPGDTLNLILINDLGDPADISNIHFHGLHVTPMGKGDNVLTSLSPGESVNVSVKIPDNHATGLDWYHPHLHGLTNEQVSSGLAGQLIVNPRHDLPDIAKFNPQTASIHYLALNTFGIQQINRVGQLGDPLNTNPNVALPAGTPLQVSQNINGEKVYTLSDAPFVGYNGKTLGALYDPANPTAINPPRLLFPYGGGPQDEPVENVIHTVNGQYNPTMQLTTGEWHTFGVTNTSVNAFHVLQLIKDTGTELIPQEVSFVGFDGDASGVVPGKRIDVAELPLLGPGGRITLQEWFSEPGTYYLISNATNE